MNLRQKCIIATMAAILIIMAVIIGFAAVDDRIEQTHPRGPMTGMELQDNPGCTRGTMIYIPAYRGDGAEPGDRVLIGTPAHATGEDGNVYWYWFYESKGHAMNRTAAVQLR